MYNPGWRGWGIFYETTEICTITRRRDKTGKIGAGCPPIPGSSTGTALPESWQGGRIYVIFSCLTL